MTVHVNRTSMHSSSVKPKKLSKGTVGLQIALMVVALIGCAVNIVNLSHRKTVVCAELSTQFQKSFVDKLCKTSESGTVQLDFQPFEDKDKNKVICHPSLEKDTLAGRKGIVTENCMKGFIESCMKTKLKNPFLFGFVDLGVKLSTLLGKILYAKSEGKEDFLFLQSIKFDMENYFRGSLSPEKYALVNSAAILCLSQIPKTSLAATQQTGSVPSGKVNAKLFSSLRPCSASSAMEPGRALTEPTSEHMYTISREEYYTVASYLGEITASLLGHRIPAKDFASKFGVSEEAFEKNAIKELLFQSNLSQYFKD
ncbi:hypothetical protein NECID01_0362 [Nematocida sp. AWRm77]|nr:hypothetical protein NECID01_0362 [Nematocida sp. AWRm77]